MTKDERAEIQAGQLFMKQLEEWDSATLKLLERYETRIATLERVVAMLQVREERS